MPRLLTGAGLAFLGCAALVAVTGGFQTSIGPLRFSATSASRLVFEAAVLLLLGECARGMARPARFLALIGLFLIAGAADSHLRRVGDGFEYLGMARNLARGRPPSLSADDFGAVTREMAAHGDPTWDPQPMMGLRGADGRFDFPHFWLYPLTAAPFVAAATAAGIHPATGFAILNIALLLGTCWLLVRSGASLVAVLFAATLLWWVDKAHAEIFIAAAAASGLLLRGTAPAASLLLLGVVAAQMPVLAVLLVACAVEAVLRHGTRGRVLMAAAAGLGVAALHPLYYLWRLGVSSPLRETVVPNFPSARALITPLVDLNLGVFWFAPVLCALTMGGAVVALRRRAWYTLAPLIAGGAAVLIAATQTPNVNHGGTPGMSRYGVWLVALLLPLAVRNENSLRPRVAATAAVLTVFFAAYVFHPRLPDAGIRPSPTRLAALVWTWMPALDNPLPEVFAERVGHVDGPVPLPVATAGCEKALIVATDAGVSWPGPCEPRAVPAACRVAGALCYANGASVAPAAKQPGFPP